MELNWQPQEHPAAPRPPGSCWPLGGSRNRRDVANFCFALAEAAPLTQKAASANCNKWCNWNTELAFKSRHPGGAQFLVGDGSVHFLPETIDHWIYQYLGGKADAHPAEIPE